MNTIRLKELNSLAKLISPRGDFLEVGCGSGIGSEFFQPIARTIVATDLENKNPLTHTPGLDLARQNLSKYKNISVQEASILDLRFKDESFDFVFSLHCLEHIKDRLKGLKECRRVLRTGGTLAMLLPSWLWALTSPPWFYKELFERAYKRFKERKTLHPITGDLPVVRDVKSFFHYYPHFPFPEPHGAFSSWQEEVFQYRKSVWKNLFLRAGFEPVHVHGLSFFTYSVIAIK